MTQVSTAPAESSAPAGDRPLQFQRTVDREMVHRNAVSEVFVTDVLAATDRLCTVGAQLPLMHAYYGDHIQEPPLVDVLLVLEACRQAAICGAHQVADIPTRTSMLVDQFSIQLTGLGALQPGYDPIDLTLLTRYVGDPLPPGRFRKRGRVEQELFAGDVPVGHHEMDVLFLRGSQHEALRRSQRGSAPPSTRSLRRPDPAFLVPPALVGRAHPDNVVLSAPVVAGGRISAFVTPNPGNRGLFDHDYDHLPAMTLTEAARQLALLSLDGGSGASAARTHAVGVRSQFIRFAELDAPLVVSAAVQEGPLTGLSDVTSVFVQGDVTIAEATVTLRPTD